MTKKPTGQDQEQLAVELRRPPDPVLGPPPPRRSLLNNRSMDKLLVPILLLTWFMYYSCQPIFKLKAQMPPQFADLPSGVTPAGQAREQRIAQAYWEIARTVIRSRYEKGSVLPESPPLDFRLDQALAGNPAPAGSNAAKKARTSAAKAAANRDTDVRYWRRLQQAWLQPYSWSSTREFSAAWFTAPVTRFCVNLQDYLKHRFRAMQ